MLSTSSSDLDYEVGYVSVVTIDRNTRTWAVVNDIGWTEDEKLQGTLLGAPKNTQKNSAYVTGVGRRLGSWQFYERCRDLTDGREFDGTAENKAKFSNFVSLPYVFDSEDDIIAEGFSLDDGCLPGSIIRKLKEYHKKCN